MYCTVYRYVCMCTEYMNSINETVTRASRITNYKSHSMLTSEAGFLYGASFCPSRTFAKYRAHIQPCEVVARPTLYLVTLRVHMFAGNAQIVAHFVNVTLIKYNTFCNCHLVFV